MSLKISLEAARVNAGYSQKEAAKLLGVSNTTLGLWERGKAFPKADKIVAICSLYRMAYDNINFMPNDSL